jgi:hypothetical protein
MRSTLENLVIKRVTLLNQIKTLKNASVHLGHCTKQYTFRDDPHFPGQLLQPIADMDCIQRIYQEVAELNGAQYGEHYSYNEVFENSENEPCERCRKVRELKKARTKLMIKLGQINGHITKIGMKLIDEPHPK